MKYFPVPLQNLGTSHTVRQCKRDIEHERGVNVYLMLATIVDFGEKIEMYSVLKETLSPDYNISTLCNQIQRQQSPGKKNH